MKHKLFWMAVAVLISAFYLVPSHLSSQGVNAGGVIIGPGGTGGGVTAAQVTNIVNALAGTNASIASNTGNGTNTTFWGNTLTSHASTNQFDTNIYVGPYNSWLNMDISRIYLGFGAGNYSITNAGLDAGQGFTNSEDTIIGRLAGSSLHSTNDEYFTFIGSFAGAATVSGAGTVSIGQKSTITATNSQSSVAIGGKSLGNTLNLNGDTAAGYAAGQFSLLPAGGGHGFRAFFGYNAGQYDDADNDTWIGANAGSSAGPTHGTGANNTGIGNGAGQSITTGSQNVLAGFQAGLNLTGGSGNVLMGYQAGQSLSGSLNNVMIGPQAGFGVTSANSDVFIGNSAGTGVPNSVNTMIVGHEGANNAVTNYFFGGDMLSATASSWGFVLNGTGGKGTDISGGSATIAAGKSTGAGTVSTLNLAVSQMSTTGTNLNNLTNAVTITSNSITANPSFNFSGGGSGLTGIPESGVVNLVSDLASKLSGNQTITLSGDISGSGATAITATLPNIATAGTYSSVTVNAKGQVTAGSNPAASGLPSFIPVLIPASVIDPSTNNFGVFGTNLTANVTFTFPNATNGNVWTVVVTNGASWTVAWPTVYWIGPESTVAPVMDTGAGVIDIFSFRKVNGGIIGDVQQMNNANLTAIAALGGQGVPVQTGAGAYAQHGFLTGSATLTFGTTAAGTSTDLTITVTGANVGDTCLMPGTSSSWTANCDYSAFVSAANTVTVRFSNNQLVSSVTPPAAQTVKVTVIQ